MLQYCTILQNKMGGKICGCLHGLEYLCETNGLNCFKKFDVKISKSKMERSKTESSSIKLIDGKDYYFFKVLKCGKVLFYCLHFL